MRASRVAFLLGAGASYEASVPMMPTLGQCFLSEFALPELRNDLTAFSADLCRRSPEEWGARTNVEVLLQYLRDTSRTDVDPLLRRAAAILRFEAMKFVLRRTSQHRKDLSYLD